MNIPFIDFSQQYKTIRKEVDSGLKQVFKTGAFILGPDEKKFEEEFSKYCQAQYGVGVNSGTDALFLALAAIHVGPGDEVIVPSFTFIATALGVSYLGAKPVFVDVEEATFNMDPKLIKQAITPQTKAIIVVHLYGQGANMDEILAIAREHKLKVIEDSAQAHGAVYQGKKIGSMGDVACFSFYPTKGLGAFGDGGMIVTSDEAVYQRALMLRDYGRKGRYEHIIKGYNSRLDTVQAVILSAKLKYLDRWNKMRAKHAQYYAKLLKGVEGVVTPSAQPGRTHVYQTYAVRVKNRDFIAEEMKKAGIGVLIHYPIPLHLQAAYKELGYKAGDFPVAEKLANEELSLPMFPHMTKKQIEYVCSTLKKLLK